MQVLYRSISTKRRTAKDINSIIPSFITKPRVVKYVQELVLDELDPAAIRRLLSIYFPNLKNLAIIHTREGAAAVPEKKKIIMNQSLKQQPMLKDYG